MIKKSTSATLGKLLFTIVISLFVSSCIDSMDLYKGPQKGDEYNPALTPDFITKKNVQINISYNVPEAMQVAFEVYTENPVKIDGMKNFVKDATLTPRIKGKTNSKGQFSLPIEVAAYTKDIYVYSPTIGVPMLLHAEIVSDVVELSSTQSVAQPESAPTTRAGSKLNTSDNCCYGWKEYSFQYKTLGNWDANGKPANMGERITFSQKFSDALNKLLPPMEDNDYLGNSPSNLSFITLSEKSNVTLYFVKHNSERKNALAYYTYTGTAPTVDQINNSLVIAFPNLHATSGLETGDCVQLKFRNGDQLSDEFPEGSKIGFALIVDAYTTGGALTTPSHIMYSNNKFNAYNFNKTDNHDGSIMGERPQMVTFKADGHFVIGFEDMPRGGTIPGQTGNVYHPADYSDDVFVLYSNPIEALPEVPEVTPDPEPGTEPEPDFKVTTSGYYTFEDSWPNQGDYDLNDVVLKYERTFRCYSDGVKGIDETYTFINNGATFTNAFGYEIKNVRHNVVAEATVTSDYTCSGQGLDAEMSNATIMLFDNSKMISVGTTFKVKIRFSLPLSMENFQSAPNKPETSPFNPFIVVHKGDFLANDRLEVHLPKCTPTKKADISLFGTGSDISDIEKGIYYVRKGNSNDSQYPFALELAINNPKDEFEFVVPKETYPISTTYPKFDSWVNNGCNTTDSDWYLHPTL